MFEPIFNPFLSAYRKHDMSKGLDSLHLKLLLAKMKAYGLSDPALKLKQSYFRNRENRTRVGNSTSVWGAMKQSCPQGSSLGPLLWNIYQNDRFYAGVKSQLSAYADDHQQYSSNKELRTAIDEVEKDGVTWYKSNFLEANYSKYQAMIIARETQQTELVINNSKIDITDAFKLLGVIIDKDLNFTEHISQVCWKTSKMIVV